MYCTLYKILYIHTYIHCRNNSYMRVYPGNCKFLFKCIQEINACVLCLDQYIIRRMFCMYLWMIQKEEPKVQSRSKLPHHYIHYIPTCVCFCVCVCVCMYVCMYVVLCNCIAKIQQFLVCLSLTQLSPFISIIYCLIFPFVKKI